MRFVEGILYRAMAAALVDTGCSAEYAQLVVEFGLHKSLTACKKALSFF